MALRENYRELLQDAAVLVVARDGLDHATTKSFAGEAACNEVYIYRNFGSKEGLLQAAFNRADIAFVQNVLKHIDVMDGQTARWKSGATRCGIRCGRSAWASRISSSSICAIIIPRSI